MAYLDTHGLTTLWNKIKSVMPKTLLDLNLTGDANHRVVTDVEKNTWNNKESTSNKVASISSASTNAQYPTAKCVYDEIQAVPEDIIAYSASAPTGYQFWWDI